jgi:hypothetical protein
MNPNILKFLGMVTFAVISELSLSSKNSMVMLARAHETDQIPNLDHGMRDYQKFEGYEYN